MPESTGNARDEGAIFATIEATYPLVSEAEQQAMVQELRYRLPTIPLDRRTSLIDAIERSIGENLEWQEPDF
jgi:hypothetical protein